MTCDGLSCGEPLAEEQFAEVRKRAVFDCFKWNIEDEGRTKLCRFPLVLARALFARLTTWAVALDAEAAQAESELLERADLQRELGIPWGLRLALRRAASQRGDCRYSRFDFHPTADGTFAITEGNLDVAGGFNESSGVTKVLADYFPGNEAGGDPAAAIAASIRAATGQGATVGFLHLTNFVDDHQVARFLGRQFEQAGLVPVLFGPSQLRWRGSHAYAAVGAARVRLDAVLRFLPTDWLPRLGIASRWWRAFEIGETLWVNPPTSLMTQSKRFPLTWSRLSSPLPTWRKLLPETRSPDDVDAGEWVFKPAFAHEGYRVGIRGVTDSYSGILRDATSCPGMWVAQRRFEAAPLQTPDGSRFPSIGVYVVNGKPAGLYGRLAARPLIDDKAQDVVVLVRRES